MTLPIDTKNQLKSTPLIEEHKRLKAQMAEFAGWMMPIQYAGIIAEHTWTRTQASLFDICHMGEFILEGARCTAGLNAVVTMDVEKIPVGSCRYGFMLNTSGGIIDDLVVYRLQQDRYMLVVNAARIEADEFHLRASLGTGCSLANASDTTAKLDLQGPMAKDVLSGYLQGQPVDALAYYTHGPYSFLGSKNIVSRTGYTGELGYELYIDSRRVVELWQALLKDPRVKPAGLGARDTLRLEMGYTLYGHDIDEQTTPGDAGLLRFVDFGKDFIGKDALMKQQKQGYSRHMVYFISQTRRAPRFGYAIMSAGSPVGTVTSGSFSPSLGCSIGIGYVTDGFQACGTELVITDGKVEIPATVSRKPFYKKGSAR